MITKAKAFNTSDNQTFGSLEAAQVHEIELLFNETEDGSGQATTSAAVAKWALANKEKLADILTTKGSSKPSARAVNGGRKTRKPKTDAAPASAPAPATA